MQQFRGVEYNYKPEEVTVWKSGVDVTLSAVETTKIDEQTGLERTVWICDVDRYGLQEYIYVQQNQYNQLRADTDELKLAMNELIGGA